MVPTPYSGARAFRPGQHEKALEFASRAMQLDSNDRYAYDNLAGAYLALNRFDEAEKRSGAGGFAETGQHWSSLGASRSGLHAW